MVGTTRSDLLGSFIVASFAAGITVHQAVGANADVNHRLTQATIFFAMALTLRLLALRATVFCGAGAGAHRANVSRPATGPK